MRRKTNPPRPDDGLFGSVDMAYTEMISEVPLFGKLGDFNHSQKMQMAHWLDAPQNGGISIKGSAERIVNRANQGSSLYYAGNIIRDWMDNQQPLCSSTHPVEVTLLTNQLTILDHCFFVYGDGSISVGYDHTGFMVDMDTRRTIIHPETRFAFDLPEPEYNLSFEQKVFISGRTLFFYRLVCACQEIIEAFSDEAPNGDFAA